MSNLKDLRQRFDRERTRLPERTSRASLSRALDETIVALEGATDPLDAEILRHRKAALEELAFNKEA